MQINATTQVFGHSYDEITGIYLLPVRVFPEADGRIPLPDNTVDFPPAQKLARNQVWRINELHTEWDVVPDYRGVMLWNKTSGQPAPNTLALGDYPPQAVTDLPPLTIAAGVPAANRWSNLLCAWELVPDYSQTAIWEKATGVNLPQLAVGEPLPATATALAPPRDASGPWRYSDAQGAWETVPPEEIPLPVQPHLPKVIAG